MITDTVHTELLDRLQHDQDAAQAALTSMAGHLAALRALSLDVAAPASTAAAAWPPHFARPSAQGFAPPSGPPIPQQPTLQPPAPPFGLPVRPAGPPRVPWYRREGMVAKVMAFVGAGVLLVGVALLLILAAQTGLFGPFPRTVTGGVLAVVLVAVSLRLRTRWPENVGAVALAASGFAAAYLDIVAVSALYGWVPRVPGLVIGGAIGLAGLWLARRWDSQALAVVAVGGALLLVPFVSTTLTITLAYLVVLTLATVAFQPGTPWPALLVVRSLPPAAVAFVVAALIGLRDPDLPLLVAAVVLLVAVALTSTWLAQPRSRWVRGAGPRERAQRTIAATLIPVLSVPALVTGERLDRTPGVVLLVLVAIGLLAAGFWKALGTPARGTAGSMGTVLLGGALLRLTDGEWTASVVLGLAIATVVAGILTRDLGTYLRGLVAGLLGVCAWLPATATGLEGRLYALGAESLVTSLLVAGLVGAVALESRRLRPPERNWVWVGLLGLGVVASSAVVVTLGTTLGGSLGNAMDGFRGAHAVVTVGWIVVAGWLLLSGLKGVIADVRRRFGLGLAALAVAKLLFFDLAALPGMARVFAFMVGGIVLIALAIGYARAFDHARAEHP
jgi:uncharacterized membrane protein